MRKWIYDLSRFGLWIEPTNFSKMTEQEQDDAVTTHCQLLFSENPEHPFWKLRPAIAREMNPVRTLLPPVERRHAIYHCYPSVANDHWEKNIARLARHVDVFNGEKIAAIGVGPGSRPFDVAARRLSGMGFECIKFWNEPELREVVSFLPLLCAVNQVCGPNDAVWYGHTKGNSTADGVLGATIWRNAMYDLELGQWEIVSKLLETHLFVGAHKMKWKRNVECPFPSNLNVGDWMLAGTFYWFRTEVFKHRNWRQVAVDRYGAEAWPSVVAQASQAASVYQLWPEDQYPTPSPYDPSIYPLEDVEKYVE